ncbi:hypothetical protein [Streptomyces sp. YGL11-2]|uniref:hypothetical protein n=1 Tax=Streptomyces sp. YGL11-2 TaxID=3414028 RepID=UPI003CFAFA29
MKLGDYLTKDALRKGSRTTATITPEGAVHLTIALPDGSVQHFERPKGSTCADWRATDFEAPDSGFAFDEPISEDWGRALTIAAVTLPAR